ncbi:MAG: DUF4296 domain-containing protein [Bacteroidales bacterium]|nr:DUF4296 domain-containing protein [Bacteroidales bacterium]
MRRGFHIVLAVLLVAACGPHRIPRDDMEDIMYRMLIQDQQVRQDPVLRRQADTSLVYEGIFEAYGYNTDDFLYSLEYYLEEPARMEKVMDAVAGRLDKEAKGVKAEIDLQRWREKMLKIYGMAPDTTWPKPPVRPVDTLLVRMGRDTVQLVLPPDSLPEYPKDSLLFVRDSL